MKSTRNIRFMKDVISKTAATSKSNPTEQLNFYETCSHAVVGPDASSAGPLTGQHAATLSACESARPYSEVPGPKPLPILGNTWR